MPLDLANEDGVPSPFNRSPKHLPKRRVAAVLLARTTAPTINNIGGVNVHSDGIADKLGEQLQQSIELSGWNRLVLLNASKGICSEVVSGAKHHKPPADSPEPGVTAKRPSRAISASDEHPISVLSLLPTTVPTAWGRAGWGTIPEIVMDP
jgi:hypothetical protein